MKIEDFEFLKILGKGAFGTVWLVRKIITKDIYAMKIIDFGKNVKNLKNYIFFSILIVFLK